MTGRRAPEGAPAGVRPPAAPVAAALLAAAALALPAPGAASVDGDPVVRQAAAAPVPEARDPAAGPAAASAPARRDRAVGHAAGADTVRRWSLALRGGFSSPRGDLADHADDGVFLGLAAGYRDPGLSRVTLTAELSLENMERGGGGQVAPAPLGPDIELWRLMVGASVDLLEPGLSPWEISALGVFGATLVASSEFHASEGFTTAHPTLGIGLAVAREISHRLAAFGRADAYLWVHETGRDETNFFGREATLTHTLGLRWRL